jgi:phasin family protein
MSSITEQFSAATKSQLEAQFQIFSTFASTAVASAEKVIALNLSATKASVEKSSAAAKQLLAAKDPQEFFRLSATEPASFDKLLAYGRELVNIAATAQSELIKSTQGSIQQVTQVTELVATPATVLPKTPPALAAVASTAVHPLGAPTPAIVAKAETPPANEPVASPPAPKAAKPKPAAAPITAAEQPIEVKVAVKPSFPVPPPKPTSKLKPVAAKPKK